MKEAEDDKGTFRVNINCREDDDKIKTTTRMKRFLDVEKPDQISTLLGHFEFFGHVSQRNFFFGSRCLINTEFGDKNSSDKKKKSGGEKAAKLRRKKIRKPFGLEPLDATYRKYGIAEIRGSFGSQGRLEGPVWIRMGDHSLIQVGGHVDWITVNKHIFSLLALLTGMSRNIYPLAAVQGCLATTFRCSFALWQQIM